MFWFCTDSGFGTDSGSPFGAYYRPSISRVNHNEGVLLAMVR